jgi:osmotically-inducible protein OsmY
MSSKEQILEQARSALRSVPGSDLHGHPIAVDYRAGTLTLEGEVKNVAVKKLSLEAAAAMPGVDGIVDRLRVLPAQVMGDQEIRDHVRNALLSEPALAQLSIGADVKGDIRAVRVPTDIRGEITISVSGGVVTLGGDVPGLVQKRLAGVLAWWVPGVRDVVNGLAVTPPEGESEAGITDAVRIALEKDPFVNPSQIGVHTHGTTVVLSGIVPTESEREMAEFDAWYVFGVDKVVNRIEVHR